MIETHHLSKLYGRGVYALRDLTMTIDKGEFLFLTGPSGADTAFDALNKEVPVVDEVKRVPLQK